MITSPFMIVAPCGCRDKAYSNAMGKLLSCKADGYSLGRVIAAQVMLAWGIFHVQKLSNTRCEENTG